MKLARGHIPPGIDGFPWHYPIADGVMLKTSTEEMLIQLMSEYRLRNSLPPGNPESEIDTYYCAKYPQICHKEVKDYFPDTQQASQPRESMLNRVSRWAAWMKNKMPRGGYKLVPQQVADERGKICVNCAKNAPWRGGCTGCSQAVLTLLAQIRGLRSSAHQGSLMACSSVGWELPTAVHQEIPALELTAEQIAELPQKCWRKI